MGYTSQIEDNAPFSDSGEGPGRGQRGAECWNYGYEDSKRGVTGTGGGGGSHASQGTAGEDRFNASAAAGTPGPACTAYSTTYNWGYRNESVVGVRGVPGPTYGDPEVIDI